MSSRRSPVLFRVARMRRANAAWLAAAARPLFDHPPEPRALREYLADSRNVFLVALGEDGVVGFLRGTTLGQLHTRRPQMFLYEIGVSGRHRRLGVGKALIVHLLQYCRDHRFDEMFVLTDPRNLPAVRLYRSTGGVTETTRDRMYVYPLGARAKSIAKGHRLSHRRVRFASG